MKLIVLLISSFVFIAACNNNDSTSNNIDSLNQARKDSGKTSLLGVWKVNKITESTFDMNDGELLKGPFSDSIENGKMIFAKDSIQYTEGVKGQEQYVESVYSYSNLNDSTLSVKNVASGDSMKFVIQQLTANSLRIKNTRLEEKRGNRYEVIIECSKQ